MESAIPNVEVGSGTAGSLSGGRWRNRSGEFDQVEHTMPEGPGSRGEPTRRSQPENFRQEFVVEGPVQLLIVLDAAEVHRGGQNPFRLSKGLLRSLPPDVFSSQISYHFPLVGGKLIFHDISILSQDT